MSQTIEELWHAFCRQPDEAAFAPIYRHTRALVWTLCCRILGNPEDARDAFQATYCRLLAEIQAGGLKGDASPTTPQLIYRLAVREAHNLRLRRARRTQREITMESLPEKGTHESVAENLLAQDQLRERLEGLVLLLPERDRLPVQLHFFHGLSQIEIAEALGCDKSTISRRMTRGLRKLERMLRRAGLSEAALSVGVAGAVGGTAALLEPPAALAAGAVFAQAQAALAAGTITALGSSLAPSLIQTIHGVALMKIKLAVITALLSVGIGGLVFYGKPLLAGKSAARPASASTRQISRSEASNVKENAPLANAVSKPRLSAQVQPKAAVDGTASQGQPAIKAETTTRTLTVRVVWSEDHKPVPRADVILAYFSPGDRNNTQSPPMIKVQTTAQGEALIRYPASWQKVLLKVSHPKGAQHRALMDLPAKKPIEVQLGQGARLFGSVWFENKPDAGADVVAYDVVHSFPALGSTRRVTTDKTGGFSIDQLAGGRYQLVATHGGLRSLLKESEVAPITLVGGEESGPHDLTLRMGNTLTGVVRDQVTKAPIAGADVVITNQNPLTNKPMPYFNQQLTKSGANGAYKLEGLPAEDLRIGAMADNYVVASHTLHPAEGINFHDFELEPGAQVEVLVTDDQGRPVEGATLDGHISNLAQTNAQGKAILTRISRTTPPRFWAHKDGYKDSGDGQPQFTPGQTMGTAKLVLMPLAGQGFFSGRVSSPSGEPLSGIHVRAGSLTLKFAEKNESLTAADGSYRLAVKARDERYVLSASVEGRNLAPAWQGDLTPGTADKPAEANFSLGAAHALHGIVVDSDGKPIPLVSIKVCTPERFFIYDGMPLDEREQLSDETGSFVFRDLPAGEVELILEARGWVRIYRKRVPVDQEARIVMTPIGAVLGRVVDAQSGEAIPAFNVKITGPVQQESGYHGIYTDQKSFTTADGRFALEEIDPRGDYEVTAEADGYASELKKGVRAVSKDKAQEIRFSLSKGNALKGRVVDARTGAPLAGLPVMYGFYGGGYFDWYRVGGISGLQKANADAKGVFTFQEGSQPGALLIRAPGYGRMIIKAAERDKYLKGGELVIPLEPAATLTGTYSLAGKPITNVAVSLMLINGRDGQGMEFTKSDLQGKYHWESLAAGDYFLAIFADRITVTRRVRLKPGEQKQADLMGDLGASTLQGRVVDSSGKARGGYYVSLRPSFPSDYNALSCRADGAGGYRFEGLADGDYSVHVSPPSSGPTPPPEKTDRIRIQGNMSRNFTF